MWGGTPSRGAGAPSGGGGTPSRGAGAHRLPCSLLALVLASLHCRGLFANPIPLPWLPAGIHQREVEREGLGVQVISAMGPIAFGPQTTPTQLLHQCQEQLLSRLSLLWFSFHFQLQRKHQIKKQLGHGAATKSLAVRERRHQIVHCMSAQSCTPQ